MSSRITFYLAIITQLSVCGEKNPAIFESLDLSHRIAFAAGDVVTERRPTGIVIIRQKSEICVMRPDGSDLKFLTHNEYTESHPAWSPDGNRMAYRSANITQYPLDVSGDIIIMDFTTHTSKNVTNHESDDTTPSWSPDGTRIAFSTARNGNYEIYTMNPDGTDLVRLTNHIAKDIYPRWSPDGTRIAYQTNRAEGDEVFIMHADGSNAINLTNNERIHDGMPDWSPDGYSMVFTSTRNQYSLTEIWRIDIDGTNLKRLTVNDQMEATPRWSPNGSVIVYCKESFEIWNLYLMRANGTGEQQITNFRELTRTPDWEPF